MNKAWLFALPVGLQFLCFSQNTISTMKHVAFEKNGKLVIFKGKPILHPFKWDATKPEYPVWSQAFSEGNGTTWEWNRYMYLSKSAENKTAQILNSVIMQGAEENGVIEIRTYNLKKGTREQFNKLFTEQALPLLLRYQVEVVAYGPSKHDSDTYFLSRAYKSMEHLKQSEDEFYGSNEWKKGPREAILALIENYTTLVLPAESFYKNFHNMKIISIKTDQKQLSELNAQFIQNFITGDTVLHNEIIHKDFICIQSNGQIVERDEYMKGWADGYIKSGNTSFSIGDENIRIFGDVALVRSKTTFTRVVDGKAIQGHSVYTDTYKKENGRWWCVQAQITSVK